MRKAKKGTIKKRVLNKQPLADPNVDLIRRLPRHKSKFDATQTLLHSLQQQSFQNQLDTYQKSAETLRVQLADAQAMLQQRDDRERDRLARGDSLRTYIKNQNKAQLNLEREWLEGEFEQKEKQAERRLQRMYRPEPDKDEVITDVKDVNVPNPPPLPDTRVSRVREPPKDTLFTGVTRKLAARRKGATAESIRLFKSIRELPRHASLPVTMEEVIGPGTVTLGHQHAHQPQPSASRAPMVVAVPHPVYRQVSGGVYPPLPDRELVNRATRRGEVYAQGFQTRHRGSPLDTMSDLLSTLTEGPSRRPREREAADRVVKQKTPRGEAALVERQYGEDEDAVTKIRKRVN